ncbi:BREX system ATP-binding domain-containing protein, partial [Conexibacter stalactiti]
MTPAAPSIVGRSAELRAVGDALDAVEAGTFAAVAVEGEPGIGKTRLLDELRAAARSRGQVVLDGAGAEFERDAPFGVVVDALDGFLADTDGDLSRALEPDALDELERIFPALRSPGAAPTAAVGDERYRVHRAVRLLLERLAATRPLVIVLDDVHWADDASLEVIASVLRRPPAARVLLALAFRSGEASRRLEVALAAAGVVRLGLRPLSEPESHRLLGDRVAGPARDALYREAGGNPFYLEQLARSAGGGAEHAGDGDAAGGGA